MNCEGIVDDIGSGTSISKKGSAHGPITQPLEKRACRFGRIPERWAHDCFIVLEHSFVPTVTSLDILYDKMSNRRVVVNLNRDWILNEGAMLKGCHGFSDAGKTPLSEVFDHMGQDQVYCLDLDGHLYKIDRTLAAKKCHMFIHYTFSPSREGRNCRRAAFLSHINTEDPWGQRDHHLHGE